MTGLVLVMSVSALIWVGLFLYLLRMESRVRELEKR